MELISSYEVMWVIKMIKYLMFSVKYCRDFLLEFDLYGILIF